MRAAPTVHADPDPRLSQPTRECGAGKLRPLIRVENQRPTDPQRVVQAIEAEPGLQRVGEPPRQHLAAIPVQDRRQVHEPREQPNVGDIGAPHLVRSGERHASQQVRVNAVLGIGLRQPRFGVNGRQAHLAHQPQHPLAIHRIPGAAQHGGHPPTPVKRMRGVLLVQTAHQFQVQGARCGTPVIPRAPVQPQQPALYRQRQGGMARFDPPPPHGGGFSPDFFFNHSTCTCSRPIRPYSASASVPSSTRPRPRRRSNSVLSPSWASRFQVAT